MPETAQDRIDRAQGMINIAIAKLSGIKCPVSIPSADTKSLRDAIDLLRTANSVVGSIPAFCQNQQYPFRREPDPVQAADEATEQEHDLATGRRFRPH